MPSAAQISANAQQFWIAHHVPPVVPLPPIPDRLRVCGVQTSLAGLTYQTAQYGPFPAGWFFLLTPADRQRAYAAHHAAGDTHIPISISSAYLEPGTLWPVPLLQGHDYTNDLPAFKAILRELIVNGFVPDVVLAGDAESVNDHPQYGQYNDPVGKTYGYTWLMQNLWRILSALQDGEDLTPYCLFRPGWDAVFYGWEPSNEKIPAFGRLFRSLLPHGHLAIEHNTGHIPIGNGPGDYAAGGGMQDYDAILSEFDDVHADAFWQVAGRMLGPAYVRPPDQPVHDDPHPPWYLAPPTDRGPYVWCAFEPTRGGAYEWVRGWCSVNDVNAVRSYMRRAGARFTG